jgi:pilus assembly protein CpaE
MSRSIQVLIASRSQVALEAIKKQAVRVGGASVTGRLIVNGHTDPLEGLTSLPDVLVLRVAEGAADEIGAYFRRAPAARCPLIVVCAAADPAIMRLAMQAGARDFITEPADEADLVSAITQIASEQQPREAGGRSVAFINASGGCGATFLASSTAHLLRASSESETALVDLDMLFSPVPHYVDVEPKLGLAEAMGAARELDEMALRGYMAAHASGLQILAAVPEGGFPDRAHAPEQLRIVMDLLSASFDHVVYDVPNQLDPLGVLALERADDIVVVLQQSLPALRNAVRLISVLRSELAVPSERITAIVNRFRKGSGVEMSDITNALKGVSLLRVPNHYLPVTESIAMGVPLYEHARNSSVITALRELEERLGGRSAPQHKGLLTKTLTSFIRS